MRKSRFGFAHFFVVHPEGVMAAAFRYCIDFYEKHFLRQVVAAFLKSLQKIFLGGSLWNKKKQQIGWGRCRSAG